MQEFCKLGVSLLLQKGPLAASLLWGGVDLLGDVVCRNADTLIFNLIISQVTKKFFNSIWFCNF